MRIFIAGGSKSGKSLFAQTLAQKQTQASKPLYYVATMKAYDNEDEARIERHLTERAGWGFATVEKPLSISTLLDECDLEGSFLLDSLTALLANEMFRNAQEPPRMDQSQLFGEMECLCEKIPHLVIVSDLLFSDAIHFDDITNAYLKALAQLHIQCAHACDVVIEVTNGIPIIHKGNEHFENLLQ